MLNFFKERNKINKIDTDMSGIIINVVSTVLILNMPYVFQTMIISYLLGTNSSFQNATKDLLKLKNI